MAHAYTPGLQVSERTVVRKERRLPLKGEVLIKEGDTVEAEQIIARAYLPGDVELLNIAGQLGVSGDEIKPYLKKKEGDEVKKGEIIAESKGLFGMFKTQVKSPIDGVIESISFVTGQAILRHPPQEVSIKAYINGTVEKVIPEEGAIIRTVATFIQGIFGIGGEGYGEILPVCSSPDETLTPELIPETAKGKVIVGGSFVTYEALQRAVEVGATGVVVGGIDADDLRRFLGYDIGVAITGTEKKGTTLIVTEGFGRMNMAKKTFELLTKYAGRRASINGATQIRAGVMRPEVIITQEGEAEEPHKGWETGLEVGHLVRIIREPYFGQIGRVVELPPPLEQIETEAHVRILKVKLDDKVVTIPRANVEIIQG